MNQRAAAPRLGPDELDVEYRALLQFLHLAPVGLVRARADGEVVLMNPTAAQLLNPIGLGDGDTINLLDVIDKVTPDIRMLVEAFHRSAGVICENYRVLLPETRHADDAPEALGITALRLQADPDCLMFVLTDESAAVKLQRLQASWIR